MATAVSKRQQARNERMLQDLIRTVPGNDRCADCGARNPGWASWNLGTFLCMRCAALHRKLGTHVSKVKSLSMDTWSTEQVENMKKVGNIASNKVYNPKNTRPDIPVDVDEADAAIEKHIRQKYDSRALSTGGGTAPATRQNTGSTGTDLGSWSEDPPDLPPKPSKRFGFTLRSTSAALPKQKTDRFTPPLSPAYTGSDRSAELPSPKKESKPSRLFGMRITTVENNFNTKLTHLRDMGFSDNQRNTEMLKSMNGNLDKTVEALVRLGENCQPLSRTATPGARALTPVSMKSAGFSGLSVEKKSANNNPWEIREDPAPPVPQRSASVPPALMSGSTSWNPFLQLPQSQAQVQVQQPLENSFQHLSVAATSSPEPQMYDTQQQYQQQAAAAQPSNPWQAPQAQQTFPQSFQQPAVPGQQYQLAPAPLQLQTSSNPFMQQSAPQQSLSPNNPWMQQLPQQQGSAVQHSSNPFGGSWQQPQQNLSQQAFATSPQSMYTQQPDIFSQTQQQSNQGPPQQQSQFPTQAQQFAGSGQNPWQQQGTPQSQPQQSVGSQQVQAQQAQQAQQQQYQQQYHQQYQQFNQPFAVHQPQQPIRHDKTSILALYNTGPFAPQQRPLQTLPENDSMPQHQPYEAPQRSATMPMTTSFAGLNAFPQISNQPQLFAHASKESVDFQGFANSGRHSPDAFAGLSARYNR